MSAVEAVQAAPQNSAHPLNMGNQVVNAALLSAIGALYLLNDMGVCVINVSIRGGRAVLRLDRPPPDVEGGVSVSRPHGILREEIRVAPFAGCQLEWSGIVASRQNVTPIARSAT